MGFTARKLDLRIITVFSPGRASNLNTNRQGQRHYLNRQKNKTPSLYGHWRHRGGGANPASHTAYPSYAQRCKDNAVKPPESNPKAIQTPHRGLLSKGTADPFTSR